MRLEVNTISRVLAMLICALVFAGTARADKIVLKNGRKIIAYNVVEDGDKIRYETSAGQLALPKSIVDHIEKGGLLPPMGSPAAAAASLNLEPPEPAATAIESEIDKSAVHDGSVDRNYISNLEDGAGAGGEKAMQAARAHLAASRFEMVKGDLERALADARQAVLYAPEDPATLMELAYLYLRRSEFKQSLEYLERAKRYAPKSPDVYKLEGWTYYGLNRPDQAVAEWKKSLALRPDSEVQAALDKALRDKNEEENYRENESTHFQLKYNGAAEPGLAREVLHTLEGHYQQIESELNFSPPDPIGVVLYTQEGFADITRAPGWVGALNDGRIRVPVQGLSVVNSELSRILRHELTHSFIQQKTHGRAPTWIQEGVAQWMEGKRSDESAAVLVQVYDAGQSAPLGQLEGSWMRLPGPMASYAYAWALANVEYIVQTQGMGDIERILDRLAAGTATEQAVREVLHDDYADLAQATAEYLKKNYGR
ncbi:MAG TPA: tetratricopeptide repeat protein [Candidatus Limnocylindrales bacterium]|nr:tetratricopeptide repeat protein [Candidatus Limnocylindrales bacterium]